MFLSCSSKVRSFVAAGLNLVVACSFSKNFGLYGERLGAVHVVTSNEQEVVAVSVVSVCSACVAFSCSFFHITCVFISNPNFHFHRWALKYVPWPALSTAPVPPMERVSWPPS